MLKKIGLVAASAVPFVLWAGLSSQSYVQNGLVLQLDGINNAGTGTHNASATTWKDLKGSSNFTVDTSCASFTGGNGLKKNASGYMAKYATARTDVRTIETSLSGIGSSWIIAVMVSRDQNVTLKNEGSTRKYCFDDNKYGLQVSAQPNPATVAAVYSSRTTGSGFFVNGVQPTGSAFKDYWTASPGGEMSLGGRVDFTGSDTSTTGFTIHGVRLYDRSLTSAEAWHNWAVDSIRYYGTTPTGYRVSGDALQFRVSATASGNGTVTMNGGAAGASAETWQTSTGSAAEAVTLVAASNAGAGFRGWTGDTSAITSGSASVPSITVRADRACALTATFAVASEGWTGAGADTKITTAENWATATDFTGGTAIMKVMGGTRATVPADGTTYAFKGVSAQTAGFTFEAEAGAKAVTLGAQGLTNTAGNVTWSWPTTLGPAASRTISDISTTAQTWFNGTDKTLAIRGPLAGADIYFQGRGRVDVYSTNEIATAFVGGSNSSEDGRVDVYLRPGAQLCGAGGLIDISCVAGYGLHLMGNTLACNVKAGTQNTGSPGAFFVEANTTNVIAGSFNTQWANESMMGIAGHLTVRGGMSVGGGNSQGRWEPFGNSDTYKNGYLKVETKPISGNRMMLPRGTLELAAADNVFATRGLFVEGGLVKTTVANALQTEKSNKLKLTSGTFDLGGFDQGVDLFCGNGGTVTSAAGAQLHVVNSDYFFDSRFDKGKPASNPALNLGTNMTVCTTLFTGGAGLAKEGTKDLYIAAANTSTGVLSVAQGRLVLSAANGSAKYPGTSFTKTQGSWAGRVEVTGGTLAIEHAAALGPKATLYVSGGSVELAAGVVLPAHKVYVTDGAGGWTELRGTCGGTASGAANQPTFPGTSTPVFTGKGSVCVGATLPDGWPAAGTAADWTEGGADKLVTTSANWNPTTANLYDGSLFGRFGAGTRAILPDNDYVFVQGLTVAQPNFAFANGTGTTLFLGQAGLTNATTGVTWNWPASIGAFEPLWWLAKDSTMELRAPLSGTGKLKIWGGGRLDVYSTNTIQGTVYVGDNNDQSANPEGEVYVYLHPGAQLAGAGGTVSIGCRAGWGLHLMGNTLDCNVIAGTQNNGSPAALYVEPGTTNVLAGSFTTQWSNESTMGIKGYLCVQGGLTATSIVNAQGCWRPFARYDKSYATGYLKVETKPMTADRVSIPWGTLELAAAGNVFATRGLFVEGGLVKTTVANALQTGKGNKLKLTGGTFDLCGLDQGVDLFCGNGGTVTSAAGAQLHVVNSGYFFDSKFDQGKPASSPALNLGTNMTVCTTLFTGGAGLAKEGTKDLYLASVNASTGTLTVAKGRLVMSKYDSNATYPGTAIKKTYGTWSAGRVEVTNATLVVEHKNAFAKATTLSILNGGQVELAAGITARVGALFVNGVKLGDGVYGGPSSSAATKLSCFTGTGVIRVGDVGLLMFIAGTPGSPPPPVPSELTLRFGVLSDVHITRRGSAGDTYVYGSAQTFVHALRYFRDQNVDAVVLAGDMADRGLPENLQVVADAWREVFPDDTAADGRHVERVFIYGNHDADANWFKIASGVLKDKTEAEQTALIARAISAHPSNAWVNAWGEDWSPAYTKTVKGYRFIAAHWGHEAAAADIVNRDCFDLQGSKPFFYVQHPQLTDGIYGSYGWDPHAGPTAALSAYPNAITFSGHTHYSTSLEASIYQKDFTSIGTSSLCYISKFGGGLNEAATSRDGREGLLVSVYGNRVVIKRREFVKDADLGPDWLIEPGSVEGAAPYTYAHEQERLAAPEFPSGATVGTESTADGLKLTLPRAVFDASHARAPFFDLTFKSGGTTLYTCTLQQNACFAPFADVPATTVYTLPKATFDPPAGCTLEVKARDFYGRTSAPIADLL